MKYRFTPWPLESGGCVPSHAGHPAVADAVPGTASVRPAAIPIAARAPPSLVIRLMHGLLTCVPARHGIYRDAKQKA